MKYPQFFALALGCLGVLDVVAQTNFDGTDNLANLQKQYIIRIDVANGNVLLPYKKKLVTDSDTAADFRRTVMDFKNQNKQFTIDTNKRMGKTYLVSRRMYSPKVGGMVRIIYENVPQNYDVTTSVEMNNKNLEYAGLAQNYLNAQNEAFKKRIDGDTMVKNAVIKNDIDAKKYNDSLSKARDTLKGQIKTVTESLHQVIDFIGDTLLVSLLQVNDNKKGSDLKNKLNLSKLVNDWKNDLLLHQFSFDTALGKEFKEIMINATAAFSSKLNDAINVKLLGSDEVYKIIKKAVKELKDNTASETEKIKTQIDTMYENQRKIADSLRLKLYYTQDSLLNYTRPITITPQPFQVYNTDVTHIVYSIKKGNADNAKVETREIILKNKGGFKLDFSTGIIGTGLVDDNFKVVADSANATTASLVNENKGNFTVGFGLFTHAYIRSGGRINFALSAGLMVNSSNQNINYTTGLSIPLGLEERLIFNAGIVYGKVKRLAAGYTENSSTQNRILLTANSGNVATVEKWDNSWYMGISFNIASINGNNKYAFKL